MISALEALARLRAGNGRFVAEVQSHASRPTEARRLALAAGQAPFAIILGCSDSRVPAEIVFDQGLGDLFVIRVAGNIVAASQVGSVEFAAARYATRLVVVLGHSQCGAILATLEELQQPQGSQSPNLRSIVDRVRPAVEGLLATSLRDEGAGSVRTDIVYSAEVPYEGREILLLADIVDTGITLNFLLDHIRVKSPASLRVAAIIDKPGERKIDANPDWALFTMREPLDRFLKEMGAQKAETHAKVTVTRSSLPEEMQVLVIDVKR